MYVFGFMCQSTETHKHIICELHIKETMLVLVTTAIR